MKSSYKKQQLPIVQGSEDKMKHNPAHIIFILVTGMLLASCSATKKVPDGDALYLGAKVKVDGPDLSTRERKNIRIDLSSMTRPRPNKRLLGIPYKLLLNNVPIFRKKLGEPPVLLSQLNLENNVKTLQNSLENRGYFHAIVSGDTTVKGKRARATYTVQTGYQYHIDSVKFIADTSVLQRTIVESSAETLLKSGDAFDLALIKVERERIDAYLKERGFYYFNYDQLIIQVDSTIGNNKVNLFVKVKPTIPPVATKVYRINDVYIYTNYSLNQERSSDTLKNLATFYKGYYVVDRRKLYKPRLFEQAMQFEPGDVYNRKDHNQTISRLVNLNLFKFVKNRFEPVPGVDTPKLNTYYYLTPLPKKSLRAEVNASTKSNNLTGSSITVGWRNRNTLRGGELFTIDATGGFEVQFSGQMRGFNTYRLGMETKMLVPRFIFLKLNTKGGYVPRTNFLLGYDILNKQKLYSMQSFRAGLGYNWKQSLQKEHELNIISINYVQPLTITDLYADSAAGNPTLLKAVEKQFILGTNYNYNYNQLAGLPPMSGGIYFNGNIDLSGNVAGLISGANAKNGKQKSLLNAPFSQYVRLESDLRYYLKLSPRMVWANRLITGLGMPYGNSMQLPYIKQFFAGGTNSIRAFRSRSVGPGVYQDTISTTFLPDQSGDIKLEINTELRAKLFGIVQGAIFVDAGNVWLFRKDSLRPGAEFTGQFLKQLAVGGGLGLRFDVTFLVVRFDVAFPFRRPYPPYWNSIQFNEPAWRRQNIVYNIGIGYPF